MSELKTYIQEYIDILQSLLADYNQDELLVGRAYEIFKSYQDPRYIVLAHKLEQIQKRQKAEAIKEAGVPNFKLVDKDAY